MSLNIKPLGPPSHPRPTYPTKEISTPDLDSEKTQDLDRSKGPKVPAKKPKKKDK